MWIALLFSKYVFVRFTSECKLNIAPPLTAELLINSELMTIMPLPTLFAGSVYIAPPTILAVLLMNLVSFKFILPPVLKIAPPLSA